MGCVEAWKQTTINSVYFSLLCFFKQDRAGLLEAFKRGRGVWTKINLILNSFTVMHQLHSPAPGPPHLTTPLPLCNNMRLLGPGVLFCTQKEFQDHPKSQTSEQHGHDNHSKNVFTVEPKILMLPADISCRPEHLFEYCFTVGFKIMFAMSWMPTCRIKTQSKCYA